MGSVDRAVNMKKISAFGPKRNLRINLESHSESKPVFAT
jgi:hypothetical protein